MNNPTSFKRTLAAPSATFAVAALCAASIAIVLRLAWDPPVRTYLEYVPIGTVLIVLVWDRLFPSRSGAAWPALCDSLVVGLALMRAIVPPLPFVSGHTLLASYAGMTARHSPLRFVALVALAEVIYTKILASGGWRSMLGGLAVAGIVAAVRRRFQVGAVILLVVLTTSCANRPRALSVHLADYGDAATSGRLRVEMPGGEAPLFAERESVLDDRDFETAWFGQDEFGRPQLRLCFEAEGRRKFITFAQQNVRRRLVFLVQGQLLLAPVIESAVVPECLEISGAVTAEEAAVLQRAIR